MTPPPWLQAQRFQQHHAKPQPLICRSATPPPLRPHSAAASVTSPPRGRHVIPRSHSVLHARPPSAPRISSASPALLDQHQQPIAGGHQHSGTHIHEHLQQGSGAMGGLDIGSLHLDYSAIQRIADGVERMVRSWTSENSCRTQVYAKAYDSLHAAVARGKEQASLQHHHHPSQDPLNHSSVCTEPSPFTLKPHSATCGTHLLSVQNLQSPADPTLVDISSSSYDRQHPAYDGNPVEDEEHTSSATRLQHTQDNSVHGSQTCYGGQTGGYNSANLSAGAPYTTTRLTSRSQPPVDNGLEIVYTDGPPHPIGQDAVKKLKTGSNMCVHNRTHNYPLRLALINEDHDREQKSGGNIHYGNNQLDDMHADRELREPARLQQGRFQHEDQLGESCVALHLQPQYQRNNQLQNAPFLRNDQFSSNSLIKCNARSRSPSVRLGTLSNANASNSLEVYREGCKIEKAVDDKYQAKVKELEISLLECATEYEVQS